MTEIPEHLLKRSKAAKAKADGGEAAADAPAASSAPAKIEGAATPAKPATAVPAVPAAPPPPKPDIPVVAAAKARKKMPFWAMATLSLLPLWTFMYVRGLTYKEPTVAGPLGEGAQIYPGGCSGCHGAAGEGVAGSGYPFSGGEVLETFPHIEDQLRFVYGGTLAYGAERVSSYGNPERDGGPHLTQARGIMPAQGADYGGGLTEVQILAVVCHERYTLGGADPTAEYLEEYEKWCSPEAPAWLGLEDGSITFANVADQLEGTFVVGTQPLEGNAPGAQP